uniref:MYB binding protein 1a n=1 Tax=Spermophilus dauricus TaxID=99837 RepID=A0A8C9UJH0_SPEDA
MAEIKSCDVAEPVSTQDATQADRHGLLEHSREFLDFFWDIAKPHQETRLEATEKLLDYLRTRVSWEKLKEEWRLPLSSSRPYSWQLLQSFEDIPLCSILQQIQEKYDLEKVKKAMMRSALFANLFGVLALFQSGRLVKDQEALLKSIKLLQTLAQHYNHLHSQPLKALMDILSEVPEATFQEILPEVITGDLNVVLSSPHHLELFLLAQQKVPTKLKKLMGSVDLLSDENIPSLVNVLKMMATSVKKEHKLPSLALNLLRLALKEDRFSRFWKEVVEQGLLKKQSWPACYLCFRLLGAALPLLSTEQLQLVMQGDLIRLFGEHTVTTKLPNQFKFVPEMSEYIGTFLEGSQDDPERQLAVLVAFSSITKQGVPVMPTFWRVTQFLNPQALQDYVAWLQDMFLKPNLDSLIEFSTTNQKKSQNASLNMPERAVYRLRKWIIHRMVNIVDQLHQEKEEALIDQVARFCLFHSFFKTKNPVDQIPETKQQLSIPLDVRTRDFIIAAFFSLLQTLSIKFKQAPDQTQGGKSWTYHLVRLADTLLNHSGNVDAVTPFTTEQRQAWDQMLETLKELEARSSEAKATAFQHLLLLVGIHLFKSPTESCDLLGDIQTCIKKSMGEKTRRRSRAKTTDSQEPPWVEVMVEILLSLLAQPSHLMRQMARNVFGHICPHLTPHALQLVLDVLNPETNQDEDDNVVVTDDSDEKQLMDSENENKDSEDNRNSESEEDSEDGEESEEEERDEDVDPGFRQQLMAVLHAGKALGGVDGEEDEEELGDEAMMALDQNLASLFAEQKLRIQARRDEKNKQQKEKALRVAFQIRVLDLIEVLVTKQPENPLVLELLEPLLSIIRRSMRSSSTARQEQDLLHKTARIFMQHLCRARRYCHDLGDRVEALHTRVEQLVQQASRQADSSVALYYFNASLYLLRVLKGNTVKKVIHKRGGATSSILHLRAASCLDLNLVTSIYSGALSSFLTKRNSPLTAAMFLNLFSRFPVICKNLLPILIQHVAGPARPRHQVQACLLLQKTLPRGELRPCFEEPEWEQLIVQILVKVTEVTAMERPPSNASRMVLWELERAGNLTTLLDVLQGRQQILQQSLQQGEHLIGSTRLHDPRPLLAGPADAGSPVRSGRGRPKLEKKDAKEVSSATQSPVSMKRKKKGFLPETKKRKKRKSEDVTAIATGEDQPPSTGKRRRKKIKAKTSKLQNRSEKLSQVNGVTPTSPAEPAGKKQQQKALPKKEVSGKSPQSALPRKKARLSLVRSPSLFQGGAKRKRMMRKKGRAAQTPACPSSPATRSPVDS